MNRLGMAAVLFASTAFGFAQALIGGGGWAPQGAAALHNPNTNSNVVFFQINEPPSLPTSLAYHRDNPFQTYTIDSAGSSGGLCSNGNQGASSQMVAGMFGSQEDVYYITPTGALRHAWNTNGSSTPPVWNCEVIEGPGTGYSGASTDVMAKPAVVYSSGRIDLFYYDLTTGALRHTHYENGWYFDGPIDGPGSPASAGHVTTRLASMSGVTPAGKEIATVFPASGLQVFYYDETNHQLRNGILSRGWTFQILDGGGILAGHDSGDMGADITTLVMPNTEIHVFYHDVLTQNVDAALFQRPGASGTIQSGRSVIRHAFFDTSWHFEYLDWGLWGGPWPYSMGQGDLLAGGLVALLDGADWGLFALRHGVGNDGTEQQYTDDCVVGDWAQIAFTVIQGHEGTWDASSDVPVYPQCNYGCSGLRACWWESASNGSGGENPSALLFAAGTTDSSGHLSVYAYVGNGSTVVPALYQFVR